MFKRIHAIPLSALVLTLGLMFSRPARADDPATQPSTKPTGTISVTVVDANNKPVAGAMVRVTMGRARGGRGGGAAGGGAPGGGAPGGGGAQNQADAPGAQAPDNTNPAPAPAPANPAPGGRRQRGAAPAIATGTTDANGVVKFDNIPAGSYTVTATMRGIGTGRGRAMLDPTQNGGAAIDVRITLRAGRGGGGGAQQPGGPTASAQ